MRTRRFLAALLVAMPATALAQGDSIARSDSAIGLPPIRRIESASAVSTEEIGSISGVRELPDGRLLLNDGARRRLVLLDTSLAVTAVVLDSVAEVENSYGTRPGILIPFRGDTTLFIDPASFVIIVIDPQGRVTRVRSVWSVRDVNNLASRGGFGGGPGGGPGGGGGFGFGPGRGREIEGMLPGTDARGRIVYQVSAEAAGQRAPRQRGVPFFPTPPDSALIVAVDLDTRKVDTIGVLRTPKVDFSVFQTRNRGFDIDLTINPLPSSDDWAVLPDGVVAFVRARDYRIEYLHADGTMTSSAKLPFPWEYLPDAERERIVDSVRTTRENQLRTSHTTSMIRWVNMHGRDYPEGFEAPDGYRPPQGFRRDWKLPRGAAFPERYVYGCAPDEEATMEGGRPSCIPMPVTGGEVPPPPVMRPVRVVAAKDLPDYRPPLASAGSTVADADGNLWIRTVQPKPVQGGPVYDIVSRDGRLVDRIQVPPGYTLAGFGRDKVVYLTQRGRDGTRLARVQLR